MELIRIEERGGQQVVSARELHAFLGVGADFTNWCKRMFEHGFSENQDYCEVYAKNGVNSKGGRPSTDYALTIDCAKEIAMLQRSEKGKQARQYFIECEKKLKSMDVYDLMVNSAHQIRDQARKLQQIEMQQAQLLERVNQVEGKATLVDEDYFALAGYYRARERRFDLSNVQAQQTGKLLTSKSKELGYEVKRIHQDRYGFVNSYHIFVLQAVLGF